MTILNEYSEYWANNQFQYFRTPEPEASVQSGWKSLPAAGQMLIEVHKPIK